MSLQQKLLIIDYFASFIVTLIFAFGFQLSRINGSHHIYHHPDIPDLINLQNKKGEVTPYQVKQVIALIRQYHLTLEDD